MHRRLPGRRTARFRHRPAFDRLEYRELLTAGMVDRGVLAPRPPADDPGAAPISGPPENPPPGSVSPNTITYQYGPDPNQRSLVLLPANPNGKLELLVHGGGFRHGSPDDPGVIQFGQLDVEQGTTVVSIGYRELEESPWPTPVDDVAEALDDGYRTAQALTDDGISDVTETGLSAGGTALALINYAPGYPTTAVVPNRVITISAPLETDAVAPAKLTDGFRYTDALQWQGVVPKAIVPITLMANRGDPVAIERGNVSNTRQFGRYLETHNVPVSVYRDPHYSNRHGHITEDFQSYPDVLAALRSAEVFKG